MPAPYRDGVVTRVASAWVTVLVMGVTLATAGCMSSSGSCVGPSIDVQPREAAPGDEVTVTGSWFREGCADAGGSVGGRRADQESPLTGLHVAFVQGDEVVDLATVDAAGHDFGFAVEVTVPTGATAGTGLVRVLDDAGLTHPLATDVPITVSPPSS